MKQGPVYLAAFTLSFCAMAHGQQAADESSLAGEWACYGLEEQDTTLYRVEYDVTFGEERSWAGEGRFGVVRYDGSALPMDWEFEASGTWSIRSDRFLPRTSTLRFLPTRGGADYEAADPGDYLKLPVSGSWAMGIEDGEFMTLESEDGQLLIECDKQRIYDDDDY